VYLNIRYSSLKFQFKNASDLYVRLAKKEMLFRFEGLYLVNDKSSYLQIDDADGAKPLIRNAGSLSNYSVKNKTVILS